MWKPFVLLLAGCCFIAFSFSLGRAQDASLRTKLIGKWTQHYTGMSLFRLKRSPGVYRSSQLLLLIACDGVAVAG